MAPAGDDPLRTNYAPPPAPNSTDINLLMMRFRPIAPKPPNIRDPPAPTLRLLRTSHPIHHPGKSQSTKGKCLGVRRRRGRGGPSDDTECPTSEEGRPLEHHDDEVEISESVTGRTLQLMIPDVMRADESSASVKASEGQPDPFWQPSAGSTSHNGFLVKRSLSRVEDEGTRLSHPPPRPVIPKRPLPDLNNAAFPSFSSDPGVRKRVLDVCLIVESVAEDSSCIRVVLGHTDEERLTGLAAEECPGFVSDVDKRVRWVNGAFERMMTAELGTWGGRGEVGVRMATASEEEDWSNWEGFFTSRVRIQYTWREERCPVWWGPRVVTVAPCDAWRLCSGGFAWRLDLPSALTLGRFF